VSERLLTARELAGRLAVSSGALLRWTRDGKVPAVKLPSGAIRYLPEEVDAWIAESHMGAAERGVSPTRADRARDGGYATVAFPSSPIRPPPAAERENEEEHDG
jgi:excisionase family DNA binding protein